MCKETFVRSKPHKMAQDTGSTDFSTTYAGMQNDAAFNILADSAYGQANYTATGYGNRLGHGQYDELFFAKTSDAYEATTQTGARTGGAYASVYQNNAHLEAENIHWLLQEANLLPKSESEII